MVLQKQTIPVLFSGGLDTKSADQTVVPGRFTRLENAVRRKRTLLQKRFGFAALGKGIISATSEIAEGAELVRFNSDLVLLSQSKIFSYSQASDAWSDRGAITSVLVNSDPVVRNGHTQAMADSCHLGGVTATVWEDSRGGVRATVMDDSTGSAILYDVVVAASGVRPKIFCVNKHLIMTYIVGSDLRSRRIAAAVPNTIEGEVTSYGGVVQDAPYDVREYLSGAVVAFNNTGGSITLGYIDSAGNAGAPASNGFPASVTIAHDADGALSVESDVMGEIHYIMAYDDSDGLLKVTGYSADLNTAATGTVEDIGALPGAPDTRNVTGVVDEDSDLIVYYEQDAADPKDHYVRFATVDGWTPGGPITTLSTDEYLRSVGLASKAFLDGSVAYVTVAHESDLQPTYFTANDTKEIVTRIQAARGGGLTRDAARALKSGLPRVGADASGRRFFPVQVRNLLTAEGDTSILSANVGLNRTTIVFGQSELDSDQLGQNLHVAGGILQTYDGVTATEHGFHVFPEDVSSATAGGGSLAAGDYSYRAIYEWVDGRGQIQRSAPSITVTQTAGGSGTNTLTIPTLRLTAKRGTRANPQIVIYRADVGLATVYYRLGQVENDPTVDTVDFVDDGTDFSTAAEILYTVGGVLENIAAPASKVAHKHKNRLFLAGLEDGSIVFSKEHVFGEGVAFAPDLLRVKIDPRGGDVGAMATLDDKVIFFKEDDASFTMSGDGPTDAGTQNDFGQPELIAGDIGCDNPGSIANIPNGIMFQASGDKGIWLLDRSLQFVYIGADVEDFNSLRVTSAVVISEHNEVRFTTKTGACLVYNYEFNQWSTFTNYAAEGGVNALGSYLHLKADGTVNQETAGYDDNGVRIVMAMETSWLSFAGIQAYQRIYRLAGLGDFASDHTLKLQLAYDFEDWYTDTVYFDTSGAINTTEYGDGAYYGELSVYGGDSKGSYQFRHKPTQQKCSAVKVRLEDMDTQGATSGASFSLVSMTFEVGMKRGINRIGGGRNIGNG